MAEEGATIRAAGNMSSGGDGRRGRAFHSGKLVVLGGVAGGGVGYAATPLKDECESGEGEGEESEEEEELHSEGLI